MSAATRIAGATVVALFGLQLAWHGWLAPPRHVPAVAMSVAFVMPLLPAFVLVLMEHRRAPFWGALAALFYFSHGVMNAWAAPDVRMLALLQVALSVLLIGTASWDGMRARFRRKAPVPPTV